MTEQERRNLLNAARKAYEAAYGAERERFHRDYVASQQRRREIRDKYAAEIKEIGALWAASHESEAA